MKSGEHAVWDAAMAVGSDSRPDWDGLILGITGAARSGKGTVASLVIDLLAHDKVVIRDGFADRLKLSAARAIGLDEDADDAIDCMNVLKTCGSVTTRIEHGQYDVQEVRISGREFLQRYGTESHRDVFGPDFWVDQVLPDPADHFAGRADCFDLLIIDDLRFPNEAARIRQCGGVIWRVERGGTIAESGHASEAGLPDELVDRVIENDGDLDELRYLVAEALGLQFEVELP